MALAFAGYYAVRFLMTKNQRFDTCSKIGMEIALLFVVCTMVTGEMWTRFEWGVWWTWEPRLTTYLILMLVVIAYFVLRSAIDEPERRATYAAVISIIALRRRADLLHGDPAHPLEHPSCGAARRRHVGRHGHDGGRGDGGHAAWWASACTACVSARCGLPSAWRP